jgi:hypothetical protein
VEAQVKKLGPGGLAKLEEQLAAAKAEHDQPIPEHILTDFPVPDVKGISWIGVQSAKNAPNSRALANSSELERHLKQDTTSLPMTVQFDHVTVCMWSDTILN